MYTPALLVFQVVVTLVSMLVTLTVAPATTPPLGSITVPLILPNNPCAPRLREQTVRSSVTPATRTGSTQILTKCLSILSPPLYSVRPYKAVPNAAKPKNREDIRRLIRDLS